MAACQLWYRQAADGAPVEQIQTSLKVTQDTVSKLQVDPSLSI